MSGIPAGFLPGYSMTLKAGYAEATEPNWIKC